MQVLKDPDNLRLAQKALAKVSRADETIPFPMDYANCVREGVAGAQVDRDLLRWPDSALTRPREVG